LNMLLGKQFGYVTKIIQRNIASIISLVVYMTMWL